MGDPFDSTSGDDLHAEFVAEMRRGKERMRRAFGERSEASHRAWVDVPRLETLDPTQEDWARELKYTGIADLPIARLPPELVALRRLPGEAWGWRLAGFGCNFALIHPAIQLAAARMTETSVFTWRPAVLVFGLLVSFVLLLIGFDAGMAALRRWWGRPLPGTPEARKSVALAALRARPFVVVVDRVLVENVPALCQLDLWHAELVASLQAVQTRLQEFKELLERMAALRVGLGERGEDGPMRAVIEAQSRDVAMVTHIGATRSKLEERRHRLLDGIQTVRQRFELEALRNRAAELAGHADAQPFQIAANIEVDLSDLSAEMRSIQKEISEATLRARAVNEVGALTR